MEADCGPVADALVAHLLQHDEVVAVVVEYADLRRYGVLHLQEVLLPVISDNGLPTLFLVSESAVI